MESGLHTGTHPSLAFSNLSGYSFKVSSTTSSGLLHCKCASAPHFPVQPPPCPPVALTSILRMTQSSPLNNHRWTASWYLEPNMTYSVTSIPLTQLISGTQVSRDPGARPSPKPHTRVSLALFLSHSSTTSKPSLCYSKVRPPLPPPGRSPILVSATPSWLW